MKNEEVANYAQQCRKQGMTDDAIRSGLLKAGWAEADINDSLSPAPQAASSAPPSSPSEPLAKFSISESPFSVPRELEPELYLDPEPEKAKVKIIQVIIARIFSKIPITIVIILFLAAIAIYGYRILKQ